jgi:23S rRNA (uracil1939-C5)-methyltransferase
VELSENLDASERAVDVDAWRALEGQVRDRLASMAGLTRFGPEAFVTDVIELAGASRVTLRRNVAAFFQSNRYLLPDLVAAVTAQVPEGCSVLDLYAGAGVFSVPAAVARGAHVTAVEGDRAGAADLVANARISGAHVTGLHRPVERFLAGRNRTPDLVIVDPPRTGLSRDALAGVLRMAPPKMVYVSCDPATLARDSRHIIDSRYEIARVSAFDLFPNTAHVEAVVTFVRPGGSRD